MELGAQLLSMKYQLHSLKEVTNHIQTNILMYGWTTMYSHLDPRFFAIARILTTSIPKKNSEWEMKTFYLSF